MLLRDIFPPLIFPYITLITCAFQSIFPYGVHTSSTETCGQVMARKCHGEESSKFCRRLNVSGKLVALGMHCSMSTESEVCMPSCEDSISELLQLSFGYRILKCDCSDPGTFFQYTERCVEGLSHIEVCGHVLDDWCQEALDECTANAECSAAKQQFEHNCTECSPECDRSLERLYRAKTSDRLLCDCDYLFNASNGEMCDTSRQKMLHFCDVGLPETSNSPTSSITDTERYGPSGAENSPADQDTTQQTSEVKKDPRAATTSSVAVKDDKNGSYGLHPLKTVILTAATVFHVVTRLMFQAPV